MRLNHKNVVKCFGHFSISDDNIGEFGIIETIKGHFVGTVMELCHGTLKDLITVKTLKDYELSRLMKQMLEGIDHIHENGVIHR